MKMMKMRSLPVVPVCIAALLLHSAAPTEAISMTHTTSASYQINFLQEEQGESRCENVEEFQSAYESLYEGLQSYLELRAFSTTTSSTSSTSLLDLVEASRSEVEEVFVSPDQTRISAIGSDGSYSALMGDHLQLRMQQRQQQQQQQSAEEEEEQAAPEELCSPVQDCLEFDWCSSLCTHHSQRARATRRVRRASTSTTISSDQQESVCQWLARQELPACLQGATIICQQQQQQQQQQL